MEYNYGIGRSKLNFLAIWFVVVMKQWILHVDNRCIYSTHNGICTLLIFVYHFLGNACMDSLWICITVNTEII